MADGFITVAPDSTGKSLQTFENTIGGEDVHAEAVALVDSSGAYISTLPVSIAGNINVSASVATGAANMANGQVAATTTAATLVSARATRRSVTVRNMDSSISAYIGIATVSAGNGMLLKAGESISIDYTGLIQVVSASNSPNVAYLETYD